MKVQEVVAAGDVVYINPGIYVVPADQPPMTPLGQWTLSLCV